MPARQGRATLRCHTNLLRGPAKGGHAECVAGAVADLAALGAALQDLIDALCSKFGRLQERAEERGRGGNRW